MLLPLAGFCDVAALEAARASNCSVLSWAGAVERNGCAGKSGAEELSSEVMRPP
ncbi:hypothetical protein FM113_14985 [Leucobacter sp. 7(1)]|nr:hypothetical protein FM113_14985 [Leucobacter sp. 7(1)]